MRTIIIDADIVAFSCAAAVEKPTNWGGGLWTLHSHEADVIEAMSKMIVGFYDKLEADSFMCALSSPDNYRKNVYPDYKANRGKTRKPMLLNFAKEYLMREYSGIIIDGIEADDIIGITATSGSDEYIIVSKDKDLLTIPGKHFKMHKPDDGIVEVTVEQADHMFYVQCLTGDTTDNYNGIPGIGPKKAEKILEGCTTKDQYWSAIVSAYLKAGMTEDDALVTARLARILRAEDYDNGVKLWSPYT